MANSPAPSPNSETGRPTLSDISSNLRALPTNMVTKLDQHTLSADIHAAIRTEVATLRKEMASQGSRIQASGSLRRSPYRRSMKPLASP
ncbi:Hypothetical predicted protein [Pelobates cultripes]|uniref:Uncharacterized protein n=1 Tax=Pelobates cultripes TaxID=61616 RepID=A0AAD1VSI4_PELCU|nr:Hypothetical predicted protein [Pelobates cultripes]